MAELAPPRSRSALAGVAVPTEHGGWGLTAEPVLLGLLVAPSVAGGLLGVAAVLAFLARTPLRVVLVDRHRDRSLARTALAGRVLAVEVLAIVLLATLAALVAAGPFWWPVLVAAPLVAVELWYDTRSRSRRLAPELAGTWAISAVAAVVVLAAGHGAREALAVWLVVGARATSSIPHVVAQVARLHGRATPARRLLLADAGALGAVAVAVGLDHRAALGAAAVAIAVAVQRPLARTPVPAKTIGIRQSILGLAVVLAAAVGFHLL
ncbi:MAG: YwiC-like family protein [Actinobacteria bacterium]|nr:YwiC-like family protein [Actinomycetota bacterium]